MFFFAIFPLLIIIIYAYFYVYRKGLVPIKYETELKQDGIKGFPKEILEWYKKGYGKSIVRLQGAVDFAKHELSTVWFALFPADDNPIYKINEIEKKLIPVANEWNLRNGFSRIINIQYNG